MTLYMYHIVFNIHCALLYKKMAAELQICIPIIDSSRIAILSTHSLYNIIARLN